MANEVKLVFKIVGDNLEVFDRAGTKLREVKNVADGVGTATATGAAGISKMGLALGGVLLTGAYAAQRALSGVVSTIQEMDNIGETAKKVGLTATQLSSLRLAAQQGGVSLEGVARSAGFLSRQIVAAENATSKQAKLFKELGVDTSQGLMPTLIQLGKVFDALPDGPTKTATAMALMGRGGSESLNILNGSLEESIRLNGLLGQTMSEETAASAGKAADAIDEMSASLGGLGEMIAARSAGPLRALVGLISDVALAAQDVLKPGVGPVLPGFTVGGEPYFGAQLPANAGPQLPPVGARPVGAPNVARINTILAAGRGGGGGGGSGGGRRGGGGSGPDPDKILADATAAADREMESRERAILGLLEAQGTLRDEAVRKAEEQLRIAQQSGATAGDQLALAQRIDDAERSKLLTLKEQLETQLLMQDLPPTADQVGEVALLQAELQIVNERLTVGGQRAAELTRSFEQSATAAFNLGSALNTSLQRAVDGLLASGGDFDITALLEDTIRTLTSSIVGSVVEETLKSIDLGGIIDLGASGVSSIFSGASSAVTPGLTSVVAGSGGAAGSAVGGVAGSAAGAGGGALLGGAGAGALATGGIGIGVAAVGLMASSLLGLSGGIDKAKDSISVRNIIGDDDLRKSSGLWSGGSIAAMAVVPIIGQLYALIGGLLEAFGAFKAPTRGTQLKLGLADILNEAGVPLQRDINIGGRSGVRTVGIEAAPTYALRDEWVRRGFRPEDVGAIEGQGALNQERLLPGILDNPELDPLRFGAAAGLMGVVAGEGRDIPVLVDAFINNSALLNQTTEEVRRNLLKVADSLGYDLVTSIEELDKKFDNQKLTVEQLDLATKGVIDLFRDQLPEGVSFAEAQGILARRTSANGVDVAGFEGDLRRFATADGLREQVRDIKFGEKSAANQERELRARLATIDADLAAAQTDAERERLLRDRAEVGSQFVSLAQSRYAEGSAARRRAVAYGTNIIDDTATTLETFPVEIVQATEDQKAATEENTKTQKESVAATSENTGAQRQVATEVRGLASLLRDGIKSTLDVDVTGADEESLPMIKTQIQTMFIELLKSPQFRGAVRDATRAS